MFDAALNKLIDIAIELAKAVLIERLKESNGERSKENYSEVSGQLLGTRNDIQSTSVEHFNFIRSWSQHISFADLRSEKPIADAYVPLDTFVMPAKAHQHAVERSQKESLEKSLLASSNHVLLLGEPGAGKTTSLQKICSNYVRSGVALKNHKIVVLVRLRLLKPTSTQTPLIDALAKFLPLQVQFSEPVGNEDDRKFAYDQHARAKTEAYIAFLESLGILVLLDGLDEISDRKHRDGIQRDFHNLCERLTRARVILTSRTGDNIAIPINTKVLQIAPLTIAQISEFASRWIVDQDAARRFVDAVMSFPFADTAIRPLSLAHLCAIYERTGSIPSKPKSIYRKVVNLLLEEWDEQRLVHRISDYDKFEVDQKRDFLAHLAFQLTTSHRQPTFDTEALKSAYRSICTAHGLPVNQSSAVIAEIESHTGLVIESSYKSYEFAHKSLQEFLTAEYLVRLPNTIGIRDALHLIPQELAVATALSSDATQYFAQTVFSIQMSAKRVSETLSIYASRLEIEKPDFYPSIEALCASLIVASKLTRSPTDIAIFRPIFSASLEEDFRTRYEEHISPGDDGFTYLLRIGHPYLRMPPEINLRSRIEFTAHHDKIQDL